jgi:predicted AAA+ superfamily ATPase
MRLAIEAKATARITADHLRGLRHLYDDHPRARRIVVCLEPRRRTTDDGIEILPVSVFVKELEALIAS